jgi:nucleotide-binding universal stress UspA family protein
VQEGTIVMATMPVVVGADGSEESLRAVEWAAREATRHRVPLRIVSAPAMPPRMSARDPVPHAVAGTLRAMSARALAEAVARAREVTSSLPIDTGLLAGPPALAVTDAGAGALMLVVGARGGGGFAAMLLGSVSRYAAMHAACPVAVAREKSCAVTREVAVGIRDPQDNTATLAFAFEEAARRGATLVAVHSWHWLPSPLGGHGMTTEPGWPDPEQISARASWNLTDSLARWQDKYPGVPVRMEVVHGHPASILASYSVRADLVVIGRRGGRVTGPAVGAVQHAVLHHAHGPVAIVPSEG